MDKNIMNDVDQLSHKNLIGFLQFLNHFLLIQTHGNHRGQVNLLP